MTITRTADKINKSVQEMGNLSFDTEFNLNAVEVLQYNPSTSNMDRIVPADTLGYALKVTTSGSITYVGIAAPGSSQSSAVWQCKKIDETSGTVITWAGGSANFDQVATDLTSLTYS